MSDDPVVLMQNRRAVQEVLDGIELAGMLSAFELQAALKDGEAIIVCWWTPWDVETGTERKFRTCARVRFRHREAIVQTAYELLKATLVHELGELFVVGGERPFFPHDETDPLTNDPFLLERVR